MVERVKSVIRDHLNHRTLLAKAEASGTDHLLYPLIRCSTAALRFSMICSLVMHGNLCHRTQYIIRVLLPFMPIMGFLIGGFYGGVSYRNYRLPRYPYG